MEPEDPHSLTEHPVVDSAQDREDLALLRDIARRGIKLRSRLSENRQWRIHPLPRQLFAAEDFDGALPNGFRSVMFQLIGLFGKPCGRGAACGTDDSNVAQPCG